MFKIRIKYEKTGLLKFISHLELARTMERSFRRDKWPLKFSEGFNPHPKISYAAPLPVGASSKYELMEVELTESIDLESMIKRQETFLPNGIKFVEAKYVETKKKLMSTVMYSEYMVFVKTDCDHGAFEKAIEAMVGAENLMIKKMNKKKKWKDIDIRPYIHQLKAISLDDKLLVRMNLSTGSMGNLKPEALMDFMAEKYDVNFEYFRVERLSLMGESFKDLY